MSELKPCPWCGGEALRSVYGKYAACKTQHCTPWKLVEKWNTRADDKRIEELQKENGDFATALSESIKLERRLNGRIAELESLNRNYLESLEGARLDIEGLQAQLDANNPVGIVNMFRTIRQQEAELAEYKRQHDLPTRIKERAET